MICYALPTDIEIRQKALQFIYKLHAAIAGNLHFKL